MTFPTLKLDIDHAIAAIRRVQVLSDWPEDVLRRLAEAASTKLYEDGELINPAHRKVTHLWVIVEGGIELRLDSEGGNRSVLSYYKPGEALGYNCVIPENNPTYNVVAYGYTKLLHIPKEALLALFDEKPELLWAWVKVFAQKLKQASDYIAHNATSTLRQRLAHQIMLMAGQTPESHKSSTAVFAPLSIDLKVSQEGLAFLLGTSRQSINRELSWLRQEGIISYKYGKITILDIARLKTVNLY